MLAFLYFLTQVFHQYLDLSTFTELDDALLADLANTFTSEVELATNFFETLLVAADAVAVTEDVTLTRLEHCVEHTLQLAAHRLEVHLLVGTGVVARGHHIDHGVVIVLATEWSIDTHVVVVSLDSLVDLGLLHVGDLAQLRNGRLALVLLLKLADLSLNLAQSTYLVERQANDTALLGDSL